MLSLLPQVFWPPREGVHHSPKADACCHLLKQAVCRHMPSVGLSCVSNTQVSLGNLAPHIARNSWSFHLGWQQSSATSIVCWILATRANTNSSESARLTFSVSEPEAKDEDELLEDSDDSTDSNDAWGAVAGSCEDGIPSKIGSFVALLKSKNFQLYVWYPLLKRSSCPAGSWIGCGDPLWRGVTNLWSDWTCCIQVSCSAYWPTVSSRE